MTITAPVAPTESRPGRGLVIAGSVLMVISVVGGIVVFSMLGGQRDFDQFTRDVAIEGPEVQPVPGSIDFSVDAPLDESDPETMAVGIAVDGYEPPVPDCTMVLRDGTPVTVIRSPFDSTLLNGSDAYEVISSARLAPGEYTAKCSWPGEPSQSPLSRSFTVGRTLDGDDVGEFIGPIFGMLGVAAVAGLMFVVGLILLIVGLVRRGRDRRGPTGPPNGWQQQWYPQPPYQQPYQQPYHQPPAYPQPPAPPPPSPPSGGRDFPTWPTPPGPG